MKNIQNMFGLIDDEFLEEADPFRAGAKTRKSRNGLFLKITSLVACILLVINIAVLIPIGFMLKNPSSNGQNNPGGVQNTTTDTNKNPDNVVIEYIQNITNLQFDNPNGDNVIIKLSSPIIGASSEYNDIIKALEKISGGKIGSLLSGKGQNTLNEEPKNPFKDEINSSGHYATSENQEIKGDLIKRSDKYIYYLSGTTLKIYSIENETSKLIFARGLEEYLDAIDKALEIPEQGKRVRLSNEQIETIDKSSYEIRELFLSTDSKTVTAVVAFSKMLPSHIYGENVSLSDDDVMEYTVLLSLNIENPDYVYVSDITTLFGEYKEARLVYGEYLVFTEFMPRLKEISIPQYNDGDGFVLFSKDKIYAPKDFSTEKYTLAFRIDENTYKVNDARAYASYDGEIYISGDNIYITREYLNQTYYYKDADPTGIDQDGWEAHDTKLYSIKERVTEILRVSYKDGKLKNGGAIIVKGYLNDGYSLSELDGKLYAVTTELTHHLYRAGKSGTSVSTTVKPTNVSLYCIDAGEMAMFSSVERFAKNGEIVRAVKYDGKCVYVSTSAQNTDPVFSLDLTYPAKITHTNEGTIPGFATTLIDYGNGKLLGIGQDVDKKIKLDLYELTQGEVKLVESVSIDGSYSKEYKDYYINREEGLFGFGVTQYLQGKIEYKYLIYQIKNGYLTEVLNETLRGNDESKRAVYIDGYFYLISSSDFTVVEKK